MLDLECASSNDQTFSHSDLRRTARTLMQFAPGTDFICSGYSSTPNYDNMFAGSNWDAEDYDDWTVIQRDLKVNGGLIPAREEEVVAVRNKAARALQALFKALGLPPITDQEVEEAKKGLLQAMQVARSQDDVVARSWNDKMENQRTWVFSKKQAEAISKLTTADVNAALRKYIKPDEITFVLAGDQKKAAQKKQD